jgi:prevent-host-death family protein
MRSVHIAELKNRLSHYLVAVRAGQEIVIRHRSTPIAKIVPLSTDDDLDAEETALVASGKMRLGEGSIPASFWTMPAPRVSLKQVLAAVEAVRDED